MFINRFYDPFQTGNHVHHHLQDIDLELGEVCTAINKYAMSKSSNTDSEKQELKVLPAAPSSGEPITDAQNGLTKANDDESADVGYITQLDKDGNIQQVPIQFDNDSGQ